MELEIKELDQKALNYVESANLFDITTNQNYEAAGAFLVSLKKLQKEIDETFKPIIKKAHDTHKETLAQSKKHSKPVKEAEVIIKKKISVYIDECEKKRRKEQLRLEKIEKERQEAMALEEAANAETKEEANEIIEQAINETPVVVAPVVQSKVEGISTRKVWKWRLESSQAVKPQYMIPDEKKINQMVKAIGKDAINVVGGISVYEEISIAARS